MKRSLVGALNSWYVGVAEGLQELTYGMGTGHDVSLLSWRLLIKHMSVKTEPCLCRCVRLDQASHGRISFPMVLHISHPPQLDLHLYTFLLDWSRKVFICLERGPTAHVIGFIRFRRRDSDGIWALSLDSSSPILYQSTSVCCYKSLHENGDKCVPPPHTSSRCPPHPPCLSISTLGLAGRSRGA